MIRRSSPRSAWTTTIRRPLADRPMVTKRASSVECSGSGTVPASGSPKTVDASWNETACFAKLAAAFRGSHWNLTHRCYREIPFSSGVGPTFASLPPRLPAGRGRPADAAISPAASCARLRPGIKNRPGSRLAEVLGQTLTDSGERANHGWPALSRTRLPPCCLRRPKSTSEPTGSRRGAAYSAAAKRALISAGSEVKRMTSSPSGPVSVETLA